MTGIIIYKGKYGSTSQYAHWLAEELGLYVCEATHENQQVLKHCGYVILGSSVYIGRLQLAKWIKRHHEILAHKRIFLFIVCGTPASEHKKLNDIVTNNIPADLLKNITVFFLRGRLSKKNLSITDNVFLRIGALMVTDPVERKQMLTDFDDVTKSNLADIICSVRDYTNVAQPPVPTAIASL